jgi:hypothetical protein
MYGNTWGSDGALTNGLVLRHWNGTDYTLFNWKDNGDIAQSCYDVAYGTGTLGPTGEYSLSARITFNAKDKHGADNMAGIITLHFDGIPDRTITATNTKLLELAPVFGVEADDYATNEEALTVLQSNIINHIKKPYVHDKNQKNNISTIGDDFE